jgi:hypothetical protein
VKQLHGKIDVVVVVVVGEIVVDVVVVVGGTQFAEQGPPSI